MPIEPIDVVCGSYTHTFQPTQSDLDDAVREAAEDMLTALSECPNTIIGEHAWDGIETLIDAVNRACHFKEEDE